MFAGASEVLAYVAEALALCGDWPAAKAQLDEAFELARKLDERVYLTQMSLLRSRIASAEGDDRGAREAIGAAFSEAREQDAPWLELTALVAHMEQGEASKNDFDALRAVRSRIVGGADVALVKRADELLATKA
jgi:ATP/maltotriose-dependent transcriptional regulator MalT